MSPDVGARGEEDDIPKSATQPPVVLELSSIAITFPKIILSTSDNGRIYSFRVSRTTIQFTESTDLPQNLTFLQGMRRFLDLWSR